MSMGASYGISSDLDVSALTYFEPEDAARLLSLQPEAFVVVDTRSEDDYAKGHLEGALSIAYFDLFLTWVSRAAMENIFWCPPLLTRLAHPRTHRPIHPSISCRQETKFLPLMRAIKASGRRVLCYSNTGCVEGPGAGRCNYVSNFFIKAVGMPPQRLCRLSGGLDAWKKAGHPLSLSPLLRPPGALDTIKSLPPLHGSDAEGIVRWRIKGKVRYPPLPSFLPYVRAEEILSTRRGCTGGGGGGGEGCP